MIGQPASQLWAIETISPVLRSSMTIISSVSGRSLLMGLPRNVTRQTARPLSVDLTASMLLGSNFTWDLAISIARSRLISFCVELVGLCSGDFVTQPATVSSDKKINSDGARFMMLEL